MPTIDWRSSKEAILLLPGGLIRTWHTDLIAMHFLGGADLRHHNQVPEITDESGEFFMGVPTGSIVSVVTPRKNFSRSLEVIPIAPNISIGSIEDLCLDIL